MGGLIVSRPHYVRIAPGKKLPDISSLAPFKAVVVLDTTYEPTWQDEVSQWLVGSGCFYMMAWGPDCSSWDDSVDYADMTRFPNYEIPDDKFVMTTWHDDEPLEEAFWYSQFCANFSYNDVELIDAVIVHVGSENREAELLSLFEQSKTLADREDDEDEAQETFDWKEGLVVIRVAIALAIAIAISLYFTRR